MCISKQWVKIFCFGKTREECPHAPSFAGHQSLAVAHTGFIKRFSLFPENLNSYLYHRYLYFQTLLWNSPYLHTSPILCQYQRSRSCFPTQQAPCLFSSTACSPLLYTGVFPHCLWHHLFKNKKMTVWTFLTETTGSSEENNVFKILTFYSKQGMSFHLSSALVCFSEIYNYFI